MLRITVETEKEAATVLHIDGHLTTKTVPELDRESRSVEGALRLDLTELRYADDEGIQALRALVDAGAEVLGASAFIRRYLDDSGVSNKVGNDC